MAIRLCSKAQFQVPDVGFFKVCCVGDSPARRQRLFGTDCVEYRVGIGHVSLLKRGRTISASRPDGDDDYEQRFTPFFCSISCHPRN